MVEKDCSKQRDKNSYTCLIIKDYGRGEKLELKVTVKTNEGYKLLARKGRLVQEVFLVTRLADSEIKKIIEETNPKSYRKKKGC